MFMILNKKSQNLSRPIIDKISEISKFEQQFQKQLQLVKKENNSNRNRIKIFNELIKQDQGSPKQNLPQSPAASNRKLSTLISSPKNINIKTHRKSSSMMSCASIGTKEQLPQQKLTTQTLQGEKKQSQPQELQQQKLQSQQWYQMQNKQQQQNFNPDTMNNFQCTSARDQKTLRQETTDQKSNQKSILQEKQLLLHQHSQLSAVEDNPQQLLSQMRLLNQQITKQTLLQTEQEKFEYDLQTMNKSQKKILQKERDLNKFHSSYKLEIQKDQQLEFRYSYYNLADSTNNYYMKQNSKKIQNDQQNEMLAYKKFLEQQKKNEEEKRSQKTVTRIKDKSFIQTGVLLDQNKDQKLDLIKQLDSQLA
eukprot:TRINITY_DN28674_c0_g1_i1.p1 TRINITY_DN28674_c0_g1~~TRINITY_DN28674_c0_g1_i1.p1  ORF type:complete len:364 (-),score=68.82 TRINITY_DN28674_c0_g1_i1:203-1294(-)